MFAELGERCKWTDVLGLVTSDKGRDRGVATDVAPLRRDLVRAELASCNEGLHGPLSHQGQTSYQPGRVRGSAHLWYTALRLPSSPRSSSRSPAGTEVAGRVIGGREARMTALAASVSLLSSRHWMYARSLKSGESAVLVARASTRCTSPCAASGFWRKSLTTAVRACSWTWIGSSA